LRAASEPTGAQERRHKRDCGRTLTHTGESSLPTSTTALPGAFLRSAPLRRSPRRDVKGELDGGRDKFVSDLATRSEGKQPTNRPFRRARRTVGDVASRRSPWWRSATFRDAHAPGGQCKRTPPRSTTPRPCLPGQPCSSARGAGRGVRASVGVHRTPSVFTSTEFVTLRPKLSCLSGGSAAALAQRPNSGGSSWTRLGSHVNGPTSP
jgi:hypothetical protein